MEDIEHCLKPGGVVLIIDADPEFQDHRFVKIPMAKVGGDENVSGVSENGSWFARFHWGACMSCRYLYPPLTCPQK